MPKNHKWQTRSHSSGCVLNIKRREPHASRIHEALGSVSACSATGPLLRPPAAQLPWPTPTPSSSRSLHRLSHSTRISSEQDAAHVHVIFSSDIQLFLWVHWRIPRHSDWENNKIPSLTRGSAIGASSSSAYLLLSPPSFSQACGSVRVMQHFEFWSEWWPPLSFSIPREFQTAPREIQSARIQELTHES